MRRFLYDGIVFIYKISIHAPRVRCDKKNCRIHNTVYYFNPRTSCEVRRKKMKKINVNVYISIHAPRVRCDNLLEWCHDDLYISIHAPRVRCDERIMTDLWQNGHFNPRTSCEVRLAGAVATGWLVDISIHAPRVRCDKRKNI